MNKALSAGVIALTFFALDGPAARAQAPANVRVGPFVEEKSADGGAPVAPGETKKAAPKVDAPPAGRKNDPRPVPKESDPADPQRGAKGGEVPAASSATPSAVSSAAGAVAPFENANSTVTTDAPAKSGPAPVIPTPAAPAESTPKDAGGAEADKSLPSPLFNSSTGGAPRAAAPAPAPTSVYRVGVGDVLDVRVLNDSDPRRSTLYTVLTGGILEFPLLGDPLTVAGMTTEEVALQLVAELRHRAVFDRPQVRVSVRDYASHAVLISGLVGDPGTKILRREAVPLYVVVAEAQPKPEAGRAVVVSHATGRTTTVDLNDTAAMNMLVQQSDVITLVARPPEFYYVGGEINAPGQKEFHTGLTLTQAVLASGGVARPEATRVKVSRQAGDGRLVSSEYNLREIEEGQVPDPLLQPGDRVEVSRRRK